MKSNQQISIKINCRHSPQSENKKSLTSLLISRILILGSSILSAAINMGYCSVVSKQSGRFLKNSLRREDITFTSVHRCSWSRVALSRPLFTASVSDVTAPVLPGTLGAIKECFIAYITIIIILQSKIMNIIIEAKIRLTK